MEKNGETLKYSCAADSVTRLVSIACIVVATSVHGVADQLAFLQSQATIDLPTDTQTASVSFPFTNASSASTVIREIQTECDCVQATAAPTTVGAGQSGAVSLIFRARVRNGTEVVRAKVITDTGDVYPLSVTAKLHSYIEVAPHTLRWRKGEPREPKVFVVTSNGLGKLQFTKAAAVKDTKAEIIPSKDPAAIRVWVTPPSGNKPFRRVVLVTAILETTGETKIYDLHVRGE